MIYLDISRLIRRIKVQTPTGIDRVEYEYARYFLTRSGRYVAQVSNKIVEVPTWFVREIIDAFGDRWNNGAEPDTLIENKVNLFFKYHSKNEIRDVKETYLIQIKNLGIKDRIHKINSERESIEEYSGNFPWEIVRLGLLLIPGLIARFVSASTTKVGDKRLKGTINATSEKSLYLNVGHSGLEIVELFRNLKQENGMRLAFYIHDVLPISHPHLFKSDSSAKHMIAMKNVACTADYIFTNSEFTKKELERLVDGISVSEVLNIGVSALATRENNPASLRNGLVSIGTLEPRKNFLWLARTWLSFCNKYPNVVGSETLTIYGKKGWLDDGSYDELIRLANSSQHLQVLSGADDHQVNTSLGAARAYVSAAHVEGWGMPIAESLLFGTPVLVTDVAAHREVSQGIGSFFPVDDESAFEELVLKLFSESFLESEIFRTRNFVSWRWDEHFEKLNKNVSNPHNLGQCGCFSE
ncbi:glycosyltransferase [Roseibium sp. MMSF_3544]|uniref:glycosyltransferase n=1 Tax=unclassified Roseibium TaxID=2629323 RepID=UPI00273E53CC|nr:glycosyltransferase [Roseibium sp. MMSF_3544]